MNRSVWAALTGSPIRFLTSAWPWRSLGYLMSTALVGIAGLVALLVVVGVGALTIVVVIGFFVLGFVPRLAGWIAQLERRRLALMGQRGDEAVPGIASWRALGYVVMLVLALWLVDLMVASLVMKDIRASMSWRFQASLNASRVATVTGGQVSDMGSPGMQQELEARVSIQPALR